MKRKMVVLNILVIWALAITPFHALGDGIDEYLKINPINVIIYDDQFMPHYVKCDTLPIVEQGRTLVPLRNIAEFLIFSVEWEEKSQMVFLYKGDIKIELRIGETYAKVDEQLVDLDTAPKIIDGRTMVPLRFISESMNKYVEWDTWPDGTSFVWLSDRPLLSDEDCMVDDNYSKLDDGYYANYVLLDGKQTSRGICIGDKEEDVVIAYGNPHRPNYDKNGYTYVSRGYPATDHGNGIVFEFTNGIVSKVILVSDLLPME